MAHGYARDVPGLRRMHAEMQRRPSRAFSRAAVRDWDALTTLIDGSFGNEEDLSKEIADVLGELSGYAEGARSSEEGFSRALDELRAAREALEIERRRLIGDEPRVYDALWGKRP